MNLVPSAFGAASVGVVGIERLCFVRKMDIRAGGILHYNLESTLRPSISAHGHEHLHFVRDEYDDEDAEYRTMSDV